jgi:hypothetical protein
VRLIPKDSLAYRILVRLDKALARLFGYSGEFTLSAECSKSSSIGCRCVCAGMSLLEDDHCNKAAKSEGR